MNNNSFEVIPGNITTQMNPFVVNPGNKITQPTEDAGFGTTVINGTPQLFSFRRSPEVKQTLNFCPSSFETYFNSDISLQQLITPYSSEKTPTFNTFLNHIPGIVIREYIPDTALEQTINFFIKLGREVMQLFGAKGIGKGLKQEENSTNEKNEEFFPDDSIWSKLKAVMKFLLRYVTGTSPAGDDILAAFSGKLDASVKPYAESIKNKYTRLISLPYSIYYKMQSCTTSNIYELPYIKADNVLYSSNGSPGWDTANAGFRFLPKALTSLPLIGNLLGQMFGNIGISWTPWWNASTGNATPEKDVVITFDLFNDTAEAAAINFVFINTIIPNNKWIQYGLFQHSPHIYDIKLEGYNRLFACTGDFDVKYKGVLRDMSDYWFDNILAKYINTNTTILTQFLNDCKINKLIKIPDVYEVTLTFKSLLPSNFNQYLFTLVKNDNIKTVYNKSPVHEMSELPGILTDATVNLINGAKQAWENPNSVK